MELKADHISSKNVQRAHTQPHSTHRQGGKHRTWSAVLLTSHGTKTRQIVGIWWDAPQTKFIYFYKAWEPWVGVKGPAMWFSLNKEGSQKRKDCEASPYHAKKAIDWKRAGWGSQAAFSERKTSPCWQSRLSSTWREKAEKEKELWFWVPAGKDPLLLPWFTNPKKESVGK